MRGQENEAHAGAAYPAWAFSFSWPALKTKCLMPETKAQARTRISERLGLRAVNAYLTELERLEQEKGPVAAWGAIQQNETWFPKDQPMLTGSTGGQPRTVTIPESWGPLPDRASWEDEVDWVHQNRIYVIEQRAGKDPRIHLERAKTPAPSSGAVALMLTAANADIKFTDWLQKAKIGGPEEGAEAIKGERMQIDDIKRSSAGCASRRPSKRRSREHGHRLHRLRSEGPDGEHHLAGPVARSRSPGTARAPGIPRSRL